LNGFVLVNKHPGPSSFAVIHKIKSKVSPLRIGHAGSLDPAACGLLIVGIGHATRLFEYLPAEPKRYCFTIHFGSDTDSLDDKGIVVKSGGRVPAASEVGSVLARFIGKTLQEPPKISALKINGERAYKRARNNEQFEMKPREVTISSLTLGSFDAASGCAYLSTECSTGTYVRSIARDIAAMLGTYGFASDIRRTDIGPFSISDAHEIEEIIPSIESYVLPIRDAFSSRVCVTISEEQRIALSFGSDIVLAENFPDCKTDPVFAFDEHNELVAVLIKKENELFHPVKVFLK
jgi:tRNA pseudouridine55 synthase